MIVINFNVDKECNLRIDYYLFLLILQFFSFSKIIRYFQYPPLEKPFNIKLDYDPR